MDALREFEAIYADLEKRVRDEARKSERRDRLLKQLAQRFGELPATVRDCIEQAEMDELERLLGRVIPARTLADVFESE